MPKNFKASLYIDDSIFFEAENGARPTDCVTLWGNIVKEVSGPDCINQDKIDAECGRSEEALVLGFALNTSTLEIKAPGAKVQGHRISPPHAFLRGA